MAKAEEAKVKDEAEEAAVADEFEADKKLEGDNIIRRRVYASVGAGFVPIPIVDMVALTGIQIEMVARLAGLYGIPFKKDIVKTAITSLVGGVLPVAATPMFASLFKMIPIIGVTTSAVTMSVTGGAMTYAIGKVFQQHFESGGTLLNFNADAAKAYYYEQFKQGEKVAASAKAK